MKLDHAAVVLRLGLRVAKERHADLQAYVTEAFPIFEAPGGTRGMLYQDAADPERFDEVFYYETEAAYQEGERGIREDPVQLALLARWRALLAEPPTVSVWRRLT